MLCQGWECKGIICQFRSCLCYFQWTHTLVAVSSLLWFTFRMFTKFSWPTLPTCSCYSYSIWADILYADVSDNKQMLIDILTSGIKCLFSSVMLRNMVKTVLLPHLLYTSETVESCLLPCVVLSFCFCICTYCFIILSVNCWLL